MTIRPMLAVDAEDLNALRYPLLASTKMDGIRALITSEGPRTRSMKPIPNKFISKLLSKLPPGLDGELGIVDAYGAINFRDTTSAVMSQEGTPDFVFNVFDDYLYEGGFHLRWCSLLGKRLPGWVEIVPQINVEDADRVRELFAQVVAEGHEGLILRDRDAPYKFGRSTLREHGMLKVKPWADAEALVINVTQECENTNAAVKDERGYTKRGYSKEGKVPREAMGNLVVQDLGRWPTNFEIGTGFTDEERKHIWKHQIDYVGKLAKFKYVVVGGYDVPRHCVFQGFRDPRDL